MRWIMPWFVNYLFLFLPIRLPLLFPFLFRIYDLQLSGEELAAFMEEFIVTLQKRRQEVSGIAFDSSLYIYKHVCSAMGIILAL